MNFITQTKGFPLNGKTLCAGDFSHICGIVPVLILMVIKSDGAGVPIAEDILKSILIRADCILIFGAEDTIQRQCVLNAANRYG